MDPERTRFQLGGLVLNEREPLAWLVFISSSVGVVVIDTVTYRNIFWDNIVSIL